MTELEGWILETAGGEYRVLLDEGGEVVASLRGRLKREERSGDRIVPGDRIAVVLQKEGGYRIEGVRPRSSELLRRGPHDHRPKIIAANIDLAAIVIAAQDPDPRDEVVDRFLALAAASGLSPVLLVNKVDLPSGREAAERIGRRLDGTGISLLFTSAETGEGIEDFRALLEGRRVVVTGPSGVGKSTLLNAAFPSLSLRTGAVGARSGRGRHTTVGARLIPLEGGGAVVDTPGFSDAGLWGIEPVELGELFPEILERSDGCRFRGCLHLREPSCAVRDAVEEGRIDESRFNSYLKLMEEVTASSGHS